MKEKIIVKMQTGSYVYGTNIPTSDRDYKGIFMPDAKQILLQKVPKNYNTSSGSNNMKNTAEDVDIEFFSLGEYLKLLCEGQTIALDMLFTPPQYWESHTHEWLSIIEHKDKFISSKVAAFVGYCRSQAAKYSTKGDRLNAVKWVMGILSKYDDKKHLFHVKEFEEGLTSIKPLLDKKDPEAKTPLREYVSIMGLPNNVGDLFPYLECCEKKIPFALRVEDAKEMYGKLADKYGKRAQVAASLEGTDWKALMHAIRVANEAKELLTTGHITMPRPDAPLLLQIRRGELSHPDVSKMIDDLVLEIEELQVKSSLRDKPDYQFLEQFILGHYSSVVSDYLLPTFQPIG